MWSFDGLAVPPEEGRKRVFTARSIGIRDILTQLFRERVLFRNVFLVIFLLGALAGAFMGKIYKAEARILVLPNREFVLDQTNESLSGSLNIRGEAIVLSEAEIFNDRQLILKAIELIGPGQLYPDIGRKLEHLSLSYWTQAFFYIESLFAADQDALEAERVRRLTEMRASLLDQAILRFEKSLKVWAVKDADVITLSFKDKRPKITAVALEALIAVYQERRIQIYSQIRSVMFAHQRDHFAQRLEAAEKNMANFKLDNHISSFSEQKSLLIRQKTELTANLIDASIKVQELAGRTEALHKAIAALPAEVVNFREQTHADSASNARTTLVMLEARRNELLTKFTAESQYVKDIESQIAGIKQVIADSTPIASANQRMGRNPVLEEMESELARRTADMAATRHRLVALQTQLEQVDHQLEQYDSVESRFSSLKMERDLLEENMKNYAQKVEQALILEEMDRQRMDNVRIIQEPTPPHQGVNLFVIVSMASMMLGLIFAVVAVLLRFHLRQVFVTPEDIERDIGLPVLISIPLQNATE